MRRQVGRWAAVLACLLAAWGLWTLLRLGGGSSEIGEEAGPAAQAPQALGPRLAVGSGEVTAKVASGRRAEILGHVVDERGRPVATRVVAWRQTPSEVARRQLSSGATHGVAVTGEARSAEIARAFSEPEGSHDAPVEATAQSGADGTFRLEVGARAAYAVSAAPGPPAVGTSGTCDLSESDLGEHVYLRVLDGSAVRGRVLSEEGQGLSARVRAEVASLHDRWASAPLTTDPATGAFTLGAAPAGSLSLEVFLGGDLVVLARGFKTPTAEEVVIRVPASKPVLVGTVRDTQGRPVARAHVLAVQQASRHLALSDDEGRYVVQGPYEGTLEQLEVAAPGFLPHASTPPNAAWSGLKLSASTPPRLDVTLVAGGTLEGTVREQGTGRPLPGAELELAPMAVDVRLTRPAVLRATSNAHGRYRVDGVPIGRSVLFVSHPTHYDPGLAGLPRDPAGDAVYNDALATVVPPALCVFIEREGQRVTRDLELAAGVPITGVVLDPEGLPAPGAEILARGDERSSLCGLWDLKHSPPQRVLAVSAPDGRFEIRTLAAGPEHFLFARKKGFVGVASEPFTVSREGARTQVTLRLSRGATLVGHVRGEDGLPLDRAWIDVWTESPAGWGPGNNHLETGADGMFRLQGIPLGSVYLTIGAAHHSRAERDFEVRSANEALPPLEVRLEARVQIEGLLVDEEGLPAGRKHLVGQHENGTTHGLSQPDGSFVLRDLVPGTVKLFQGVNGQTEEPFLTLDAPASGLRITWKEPVRRVIEGTVVDDHGRPVPLCSVRITQHRPASDMWTSVDNSGLDTVVANGGFRRSVAGSGPLRVEVSHPEDATGRPLNLRQRAVSVGSDDPMPLVIALEPGLAVAGRVTDEQGAPLPGVRLHSEKSDAISGSDGAFKLLGLDAEHIWIEVRPGEGYEAPTQFLSAWAGGEEVIVRLARGLPLSGIVLARDGTPVRYADVDVSWGGKGDAPRGRRGTSVAINGRFRLTSLPVATPLHIEVTPFIEDEGQSAPLAIVDGLVAGTHDVVIQLPRAQTVSGQILEADGSAARGATLNYEIGTMGSEREATPTEDGRFELHGLPPGPVRVFASVEGLIGETIQTVVAPATDARIVLPRRTPIEGRIVGAGRGATWFVWAFRPDDSVETDQVAADEDGAFAVRGVSGPGPWTLYASCTDGRFAVAASVAGDTRGLELVPQQGSVLEVEVRTSQGAAAPTATRVELEGRSWNRTYATVDGRLRFTGLPPGPYQLTTDSPAGDARLEVDVRAGTQRVELVLAPPR